MNVQRVKGYNFVSTIIENWLQWGQVWCSLHHQKCLVFSMHTILADKTSQDYLPDSKCNEQDYVFRDLTRQNWFAPTPNAVSHAKTDNWLHGVVRQTHAATVKHNSCSNNVTGSALKKNNYLYAKNGKSAFSSILMKGSAQRTNKPVKGDFQ